MSTLSRRAMISRTAGASAVTFFGGVARGQTPKVRFNATSTQGKAMLRIYADAVRAMSARDPKDPLSWIFQWYIHAIPTNTNKAAELARYFPSSSPAGQLAQASWETCEPHFSDAENNFLPWHRMYVARFEAIIQAVSNRPDFSLPYWDYTSPGAARALPAEFLKKDDPIWGSLYRASRRLNSNQGKPIDGFPGGSPLNLDSMRSIHYGDDGADAGFCANLDGGLHGSVHVDVGNGAGMGSVPWAANDPAFWLHHCNIDRVWASWNKAGGKNPDDAVFLAQTFAFANASGARMDMQVADVMQTVRVGYTYDNYLPRPAQSPPFPTAKAGGFTAVPQASTNAVSGPVELGTAPSTVTLSSGNSVGFGAKGFAAQIKALGLIFSVLTDGAMSEATGMILGTFIVLTYTTLGGMLSVAVLDFVQMGIIIGGMIFSI